MSDDVRAAKGLIQRYIEQGSMSVKPDRALDALEMLTDRLAAVERRVETQTELLEAQAEHGEALRAQLAEVTRERDEARDYLGSARLHAHELDEKLQNDLADRDRALAALREALKVYGWHRGVCDERPTETPCYCGFHALLAPPAPEAPK